MCWLRECVSTLCVAAGVHSRRNTPAPCQRYRLTAVSHRMTTWMLRATRMITVRLSLLVNTAFPHVSYNVLQPSSERSRRVTIILLLNQHSTHYRNMHKNVNAGIQI